MVNNQFPVLARSVNTVTIDGVSVPQDAFGRIRLNAILEAAELSGIGRADGRPKEWLKTAQARMMVSALKGENPPVEPINVQPGRYGGTFADRDLAHAYAMWLNPDFALRVIRKFDEVQTYGIAVSEQVARADQPVEAAALLEAATAAIVREGGLVHAEEKEARNATLRSMRRGRGRKVLKGPHGRVI